MPTFVGELTPPKGRFGIVAARFNSLIVDPLLVGALDGLQRHGVSQANIDVFHVPGSLEVPLIAKKLAQSNKYVAIIAIGAIIRGETTHYDVVVSESAGKLSQTAHETGIPVINAILTTDTLEQAQNRAGGKSGNKGFDAAVVAIEMANLIEKLSL